ncbi:MAG: helix-turn-helix transcriptional regulator [Bacteroidota bacterium]
MKEKDIKTDFEDHQLILYAEKEDQTIGPVQTGSYLAGNYLDEFYHIWGNFEKELFEKQLNQEISPIARYRSLEELSISELAARAGIPKRRVKRHMKFKHFLKAKVTELQLYADVFNVPVANFFQVISTKQDGSWNAGHNLEAAKARPLTISQEKTTNPLLVITNPEKNKA